MIEKMYDNLQEKYKNTIFQILKICKIITVERLAILILIRQLEKKYSGLCKCLEIRSYKAFR